MVRLKTRYLIAELSAPPQARKLTLQKEDIAGIIKDSIARSYGDYGVGMLQYAFQVLYYNPTTHLIVVRCARDQTKLVETSLVFVTEFQGQEVRFRIARVCGCGRTCRENLLKLSVERAEKLTLVAADPSWMTTIEAEINLIDPQ